MLHSVRYSVGFATRSNRMMSPTSPLPVIAALLLALATVKALTLRFGAPKAMGRFTTIDGLRGYLAFFVFMHHSCIWFFYLRTSVWQPPPSNLFTGLGQSSVGLFFMITGFLFSTKIIDGREKGIDWMKLYVSRFFRLVPLYLFAMALLFMAVAAVSHFAMAESPQTLAIDAFRWIGFTFFGTPGLNGVQDTKIILAGVTWSLPYELAFYLCLPLLSVAIGSIPTFPLLITGLIGVLGFMKIHALPINLETFVCGTIAAILVRYPWFRRLAGNRISSIVAIVAILTALFAFPTSYSHKVLALLSLSFALIAGGATLFNSLTSPLSRVLGEMSYSLYLLHGFILFTLFNFIEKSGYSASLSPLGHWISVLLATPVLILVCFTTFHLIEKPAMQRAEGATRWIRQTISMRRGALEESA